MYSLYILSLLQDFTLSFFFTPSVVIDSYRNVVKRLVQFLRPIIRDSSIVLSTFTPSFGQVKFLFFESFDLFR